jgi:hypothetical protein
VAIHVILAHRAARLFLLGAVVGAGILAGLLGTQPASAQVVDSTGPILIPAEIDICQSDPIITMTDARGVTKRLNVASAIGTAPRNVRGVYYDVHVPSSVVRWSVAYPPSDLPRSREHVRITADAANRHYISRVTVHSRVRVSVTATATIDAHLASRAGTTDRTMRLHLHIPD